VDGTANTKDLLDSRSVVYYSLTLTMYVRAEDPLSLPLFQHTTGPAFVPWLVIHSRTVEEKELVKGRMIKIPGVITGFLLGRLWGDTRRP